MNKKFYLIYQITNIVNGKIYIGKHETNILDDNYFGSGKLLNKAKEKYGLENFVKTILFYCANREEMNLLECYVITPEFCKRTDVYNIMEGGHGGWNYINATNKLNGGNFTDHKKYASITGAGVKRFWNSLTVEEKEKRTKIASDFLVENRYDWTNKHHSDKTKLKIGKTNSLRQRGKNNSRYGTMWICNDITRESKSILKTDPIPNGWRKGRICKK